jgi:hypothetical protein
LKTSPISIIIAEKEERKSQANKPQERKEKDEKSESKQGKSKLKLTSEVVQRDSLFALRLSFHE